MSFSQLVGRKVAERLAGLAPRKRDKVATIIGRVLAVAELRSLKTGKTIKIPREDLPLPELAQQFLTAKLCKGHEDNPQQSNAALAQASAHQGSILQSTCVWCVCNAFGRRVSTSLDTLNPMSRKLAIHLIEDAMQPNKVYVGEHIIVPEQAVWPSYLLRNTAGATSASSAGPAQSTVRPCPVPVRHCPVPVRAWPVPAGSGPTPVVTGSGPVPPAVRSSPMSSSSTSADPTPSHAWPGPSWASAFFVPIPSVDKSAPTRSSAPTTSAPELIATRSIPTSLAAAMYEPISPTSPIELSDSDDSVIFVSSTPGSTSGGTQMTNRVSVIAHTSQMRATTTATATATGRAPDCYRPDAVGVIAATSASRPPSDSTQLDVKDLEFNVNFSSVSFDPSTFGGVANFRPATQEPVDSSAGRLYDSQPDFYLPDHRRHHPYQIGFSKHS